MLGSRKFCQKGSNFDNVFFSWGKGGSKYHYNQAIFGPRAKRYLNAGQHRHANETPCHLNGVSLACRWWPNIQCWLGSFVIFRGSGPILLENAIFLCFFSGGSGHPVPPTPIWMGRSKINTAYLLSAVFKWRTFLELLKIMEMKFAV